MPFKIHHSTPVLWTETVPREAYPKASYKHRQAISTIATAALASKKEEHTSRTTHCTGNAPLTCRYNHALTESDAENIRILFKNMGTISTFGLACRSSQMEQLGKRLDSIHPLSVWKYVMTTPELKIYVNEIKKKSFVWDSLLKQCARKLKLEYSQGNLSTDNVKDFLDSLHQSMDLKINESTDWLQFLKLIL